MLLKKKKQHKPSRKTELPEVPIDEANRSKSTEKLKKIKKKLLNQINH